MASTRVKIAILAVVSVAGVVAYVILKDRLDSDGAAGKEPMSVQDFNREIAAIDRDIQDLTWAGGLFKYPFFRDVHGQPRRHVATVLQALGSDELTEQQKIIAALTMQRLPLEAFVEFAGQALQLLEAGRISGDVFQWAVLPTYDWNTTLARNYRDASVEALLDRIARSPQVGDELKTLVREEIQTGKALEAIEHLEDTGQLR